MKKPQTLIIALMLLFILASWIHIGNLQGRINSAEKLADQIEQKSSEIPGRACTLLNSQDAEQLLGKPVEHVNTNIVSPITIDDEEKYRHIDSCEHTYPRDSAIYIDFVIYTYENSEIAANQFSEVLPEVGEILDINKPELYTDELVYVEGVVFMRRGDEIIQVAASNSIPSQRKDFTLEVFEYVMMRLGDKEVILKA